MTKVMILMVGLMLTACTAKAPESDAEVTMDTVTVTATDSTASDSTATTDSIAK